MTKSQIEFNSFTKGSVPLFFFNLRKEGQKEGSFHGKGGCKLTREGRKKEGSMFKGKEGDFQRKGGRKQF